MGTYYTYSTERMFKRVGMIPNVGKTKAMVCNPGFIWGQHGILEYKRRARGEVSTFRQWKKTRVSCKECGEAMELYSIHQHLKRTHGIVLP